MKYTNHILVCILLMVNFSGFAQYGKQKKADNLFNKFSFVKAANEYRELIENNYNKDYFLTILCSCEFKSKQLVLYFCFLLTLYLCRRHIVASIQ